MGKKKQTRSEHEKTLIKKMKHKLYDDCVQCSEKCQRGTNYIEKWQIGKVYYGVPCFK